MTQHDPVLRAFFAQTKTPNQARIDWLVGHGVPPLAMSRDPGHYGYILGVAEVVLDGELFDFVEDNETGAEGALVFVARDRGGDPLDLVAWAPRSDRLAAMLGRAAVLGEQTLYSPRTGGPPQIHRTPLDWLRAERDGVVIVRPSRAARVLLDAPGRLCAADEGHAHELASLLSSSVDLTRIVVPIRKAA